MDSPALQRPAASRLCGMLFVGAGCLALLAACIMRSRHLPMWIDELFAFNLIQDPSLPHMLRALGDGADGAPPLYYLLAHCWAGVFSASELSLRLFSSLMFCAAFALLWHTLRRRWDFWSTMLGLSLAIGTNPTVRFENSNLRFYGLLFALITLAVWLAVKWGEREQIPLWLLAANALGQAALVLCHPVGGFYGAALLLATLCADAWTYRRVRWAVACSYPVGWSALLLWWPQLQHQVAINHPHSWVTVPTIGALISINDTLGSYQRLALFFGGVCLWRHLAKPDLRSVAASDSAERPGETRLLLIGAALLALIPSCWVFSHLFPQNSLFLPRYLLGVSIGWAISMTCLSSVILERLEMPGRLAAGSLRAAIVLFAAINLHDLAAPSDLDRGWTTGAADLAYGHADLPVVCLQPHEFLPLIHYSPFADRFYFLLDRPWAYEAHNSIPHSAVDYNLLSAIGRNYGELYRNHIVDVDAFLDAHPAFLVEDVRGESWVEFRLPADKYAVTRLAPDRAAETWRDGVWPLLLVERKK